MLLIYRGVGFRKLVLLFSQFSRDYLTMNHFCTKNGAAVGESDPAKWLSCEIALQNDGKIKWRRISIRAVFHPIGNDG